MPGRRTFSRAARQRTGWSGTVAVGLITVPPLTKVLLASFAPSGVSETVRRIRGTFFVCSDQTAVSESQNGAVGAAVVGDLAVAAGVGSIKDPVTDVQDESWLWYNSFNILNDVNGRGQSAFHGVIDSKGQRKVENGSTLVFVVGNANAVFGFQIALSLRVLSSETVS